ncbi:hypothetical protein LPUS_08696 [Lasallia pustulata]|nr:hypothetical protein LPUS_08696 [Lasallia pustulata]
MDSSQSGSRKRAKTGTESDISSKTRKSSAYDAGFEQHLVDYGIYPDKYDYGDGFVYPDNWKEIKERLAQPRPSLSPARFPDEAFLNFDKINIQALTENTVMSKAFPIIAGTADIPSQENLYFGNLRDLTDGSITKAKPDFYDGSRPADLHKDIREELGAYIVPSTNTAAPCLPNFFTEGKGPNGNPAVCKRQALYDGAVGARGVHELRSYVDPETLHDSKAYTITSTYHNGTLRLYTTHSTPSTNPNRDYEFRMTQLRGWDMTDNPDTFRQGAGALRNARDWAKEKREEIITAANGKVPDTESATGASATHLMLTRSTGHGRAASNYQAATVVNAGVSNISIESAPIAEQVPIVEPAVSEKRFGPIQTSDLPPRIHPSSGDMPHPEIPTVSNGSIQNNAAPSPLDATIAKQNHERGSHDSLSNATPCRGQRPTGTHSPSSARHGDAASKASAQPTQPSANSAATATAAKPNYQHFPPGFIPQTTQAAESIGLALPSQPALRGPAPASAAADQLIDGYKAAHTTLYISLSSSDIGIVPISLRSCLGETYFQNILKAWGLDSKKDDVLGVTVSFDWLNLAPFLLREAVTDSWLKVLEVIDEAPVWRDGKEKCGLKVVIIMR